MKRQTIFSSFYRVLFGLLACHASAYAFTTDTLKDWSQVEKNAKGQQVYFHAWGGSSEINQYLQWVKESLAKDYGIQFHHVKVSDISESIQRLLTEKVAGKDQNGSIDLMWINGENFASLKRQQMLYGPFVDALPNWSLVDQQLPVTQDFSEPTEGLEAPWGVGQLVLIYDQENLKNPPKNFAELLAYAKKNPNRLSYPKPPEFHGVSFLKSLLIALNAQDPRLQKPMNEKDYAAVTQPMWNYLDAFHPVAWRGGKQFPAGTAETLQLLDDGALDLAITFNPNAVYAAQESGQLAETTQAYALDSGALTNIHYLAIPKNAQSKAGALVAINFLMSPHAQSRKGDTQIWGDPSILKREHLTGPAKQNQMFPAIDEIHPSWQLAIEQDWQQRYGR